MYNSVYIYIYTYIYIYMYIYIYLMSFLQLNKKACSIHIVKID